MTLYWILVVGIARLRRELLRPRLARRAQVLRAVRRPRLHGIGLADRVRARGGVGITHGQSAIALGIAAAPFVSLVVSRRRSRAGRAHREAVTPRRRRRSKGPRRRASRRPSATSRSAAAARFAISVSGIQLAEQTLLNAAVLTSPARRRRLTARRSSSTCC
jgi:hypothetical protein